MGDYRRLRGTEAQTIAMVLNIPRVRITDESPRKVALYKYITMNSNFFESFKTLVDLEY